MTKFLTVFVPVVIIPLLVFGANCAWRERFGFAQTTAADFIMGLLVFDGTVISGSDTFAPFVQDRALRSAVVNYHIVFVAAALVLWWAITKWGEPILADYYSTKAPMAASEFPAVRFALCWMGTFALVCTQVGYFVYS